MKARERIDGLAATLISNLTESGYEREEMRRVLTAAVRKLGKLGIKEKQTKKEVETT